MFVKRALFFLMMGLCLCDVVLGASNEEIKSAAQRLVQDHMGEGYWSENNLGALFWSEECKPHVILFKSMCDEASDAAIVMSPDQRCFVGYRDGSVSKAIRYVGDFLYEPPSLYDRICSYFRRIKTVDTSKSKKEAT